MSVPGLPTSRPSASMFAVLACLCLSPAIATSAHAQHQGDIGVTVVDDRLEVVGPLGGEATDGVFLGVFGDTGFPGFTSNPGFDAAPGTLPAGRIGFRAVAGLRRWDGDLAVWLDPPQVGERLRVSFISLATVVDDTAVDGFDLAVQPDGGWHRHVNFELLDDADGWREPGVYRLDLTLYSTMGLADSEPFTIAFDFDADPAEVEAALASLAPGSPCPADFDGDGTVGGADFGRLLAAFGTADAAADLDGDGVVGGGDVGLLLASWGACPQ